MPCWKFKLDSEINDKRQLQIICQYQIKLLTRNMEGSNCANTELSWEFYCRPWTQMYETSDPGSECMTRTTHLLKENLSTIGMKWTRNKTVDVLSACRRKYDTINCIIYTGPTRLIRSHSSARFCFELSGNSNYILHCNSNYVQKLRIRNKFDLKLRIRTHFELLLWIVASFELILWIRLRPTSNKEMKPR